MIERPGLAGNGCRSARQPVAATFGTSHAPRGTDITLAAAPATHTVSGHLTPGDAGGVVWAFKASDGSYAGGVLVAGDGSYSLDLVPDSYKLWITDVTGYPDQAYGPDGTFANATVVDLTTTDQPGTDITLAH